MELKYPKPNILLMDVDNGVAAHLRSFGFNVEEGSFGRPYQPNYEGEPVYNNSNIPKYYREADIIIVDLKYRPGVILEDKLYYQDQILRINGKPEVFDPRPLVMRGLVEDFFKIYETGGCFILLAHNMTDEYLSSNFHQKDPHSWFFLPVLHFFSVSPKRGREIIAETRIDLFNQAAEAATYTCVLDARRLGDSWRPIMKNKYGEDVAGVIHSGDREGLVFVFPQVENQSEFFAAFLTEYLPEVRPQLFPHFEAEKWVHEPLYELQAVKQLQAEIVRIEEEARTQIDVVKIRSSTERDANQYMYDLVTETGDSLVEAVNQTLLTLGFTQVVDMDKELKDNGSRERKREDLQIRDRSPLVLVEVKGISGSPKERDVLQVAKYILSRTRELKNEIRGLSVVNHERNLPALGRKRQPFGEDIVTNAEEIHFGLLTTWNLHKLVRSFLKLNWSHEDIRDLFYQDGIIDPIPSHYEYIGQIEEIWPSHSAIGVRLEHALRLNDTISYEFPIEYEEEVVDSLQVDKKAVQVADAGQLAGIQTAHIATLKKKMRVYRVKKD